jgi:hypothetical protein
MSKQDSVRSSSSWHDYVTLLGGSQQAGDIAAHLLAESITSLEIPIVLHELCTVYLIKPSQQTRLNATLAMEIICSSFSSELVNLFIHGK